MIKKIVLFSLLVSLFSCGEYQKVLKSSDANYKYEMAVKYYESEDYMEYYLYGGGKYLFIPRTEKDIDEYRRSIIDTEGIGGLDYLLSPLTIAIFISLLTVL